MKDILAMLNLGNLNEEAINALSEKINSIIDLKVHEKVQEKETQIKEEILELYEDKFETYKEEITEKFSNFVDEVLNEELVIPEHILEYAKKGELYFDLIEQFKTRFIIDEGHISDEVKSLLKEARDEIMSLKSKLNETISESLDNEAELNQLKIKNFIMEKTESLPYDKAVTIREMFEDEKNFDRVYSKIDSLIETIIPNKENGKDTLIEESPIKTNLVEKTTPVKSSLMSIWEQALKNKEIA